MMGWLRRRRRVVIGSAFCVAVLAFYIVAPLNVAARIGRYPGIGWLLHTYMENWARTWSTGVEQPEFVDLPDPALVRLGAGHYELGCAPCHGAPGRERNPLVRMMEPPPPALAEHLSGFGDKELYWIVWNGVRYTAMPGWTGSGREDEVWPIVAFLDQYTSLDPQSYVELAYGETEPRDVTGAHVGFGGLVDRLDNVAQNCTRCHGLEGGGRDGTAPWIGGQSKEYLAATLRAYASGQRPSGFMQPIAAALSEDEIDDLATHYARLDTTTPGESAVAENDPRSADLKQLGERIATEGDPSRMVPACGVCHEDGGIVAPRAIYPRIAGQERRFIEAWLRLYRDGPFGGTPFANVMHYAAIGLTDRQISALAVRYASLPSAASPGPEEAPEPDTPSANQPASGSRAGGSDPSSRAANQSAAAR